MRHRMAAGTAEPDTITVTVPLVFRQRRGRKTVTAPDGLPTVKPVEPNDGDALIKAVARAFRWRSLIETGIHSTVADLAAAEKVNPSYASRILRLALLAPETVEVILDRRHPTGITLDRLMRPFPVAWEQQRSTFSESAD
jgi:hypothetical protein